MIVERGMDLQQHVKKKKGANDKVFLEDSVAQLHNPQLFSSPNINGERFSSWAT